MILHGKRIPCGGHNALATHHAPPRLSSRQGRLVCTPHHVRHAAARQGRAALQCGGFRFESRGFLILFVALHEHVHGVRKHDGSHEAEGNGNPLAHALFKVFHLLLFA